MHLFDRIRVIKTTLIAMAILIAIASLLTSHILIRDLQQEEENKMEVWAEAMHSLNSADEYTDLNLVLTVINGNNTIPVIVLDRDGNVQAHRNLLVHFRQDEDSVPALRAMAAAMKAEGRSLRIYADPSFAQPVDKRFVGDYIEVCYDESLMLRRLAVYPYIQLTVVVVFVLVAIFALFTSMRSEQNRVWVGLSKETAHQLGTPISSLMAWSEVLRETYPDDELLPEMEKDVRRLETIAERFSKIGSIPEPHPEDLTELVSRVAEYMDRRTSSKVVISVHAPEQGSVIVSIIPSLFEWVVENLCKNAVDAMQGNGRIDVTISTPTEGLVLVEVADTGKGIPKSRFKSVFKPGFTTKSRGWGLGLSLAKRIVEEYHHGRIYVKSSELGKGTTFAIELKA